jgi:Heterokaryon incompatibility protein (HET)
MRLINVETLKLEEVWDETVKKYAILSHRWEGGEVSFQDMQDPAVASEMEGFAKIQKSCERARNHGYDYVWVDTCCINKESSAELSEAINSMYRWYKAAAVCYAYLSDVQAIALDSGINSSKWFERGWTLQELLASQHVVFYDQQWEILGTKQTLSKLLTLRTGIDEAILHGEPLSRRSIAQRMSWASARVTTRKEDKAYCLLGIFDVNMPMLYGEGGEKAFHRLQEQIIRQSDDHTVFAWPIHHLGQPGLLADSPAAFANCQHMRTMTPRKGRSPYSLTNRGLSIKLLATQFTTDTYLVRLDFVNETLPADDVPVNELCSGMFLRRLNEDDQYARVQHEGETFMQLKASFWDHEAWKLLQSTRPVEQIEINVRQEFTESNTNNYKDRVNGFRIATPELLGRSSSGRDRFKVSASSWNPQERIISTKAGDYGTVGSLDISQQGRKIKVIKLGFDFEYNPVCFIAATGGLDNKMPLLERRAQWQYTEEAQAEFRALHHRSPFDTMAWSEVRDGEAIELKRHPGLWALRGDRINGLNVRIGELGVLRIVRGELQDRMVWDVYLDNVQDSTFRKIFK